jgi:hypothetical protein
MRNKRFIVIIGLLFFVIINIPLCRVLQITAPKSGNVVFDVPVSNQEEFVITFIHSVNKRPVSDFIRVENDQLVAFKSRYDSFGAGMPETSIDGMELKMEKNGMLELTNVNRRMDKFTVFVGTVAQHSLQIKGRNIPLASLASPGEPLEFKIAKASYLHIWKGRIMQ